MVVGRRLYFSDCSTAWTRISAHLPDNPDYAWILCKDHAKVIKR